MSSTDRNGQKAKNKAVVLLKDCFEKPIFKAKFADATECISQLFFIKDFMKKVSEDSSNDDGSQSDDYSNNSGQDELKKLRGHFLLVESKKQADKKSFRKLHIVEIQDPVGPIHMVNPKLQNKLP